MAYSSGLSDVEWEMVELLLLELLPKKKKNSSPKTDKSLMPSRINNGCNWCDLPRDLPPYSRVITPL